MNKEKFNRSIDNIDISIEKLVAREKAAMFKGKKRKKLGQKTKHSILVACGLCMTLVGSGFVSTGMAEALSNIPIIGRALEEFVYSQEDSLKEYKTVIGETVEDNGMRVTLNEVILDEGQLLISSTFHTELMDEDLDYTWFSDIEVYIDGIKSNFAGGGLSSNGITNSELDYFWTADLQNIKLQDNHQIKIVFNNLERFDSKEVIEGEWTFEFTASGENLMENRKSIPIDKYFTLEDGQKIEVEELILTPVSTGVNYKMENITTDLYFKLEDQNGVELQEFSSLTMGYNNYNRFVALENHVTKLKVIPYIYSYNTGVETILYDDIFEIDVK
ncbi:DUF4179 domain-containing protein [Alkalihalobacillus pseudalcaliphilus]|uniref:DUF4179 domain-containing protein n=1 Tax=Alkalihalobacillus pseudalcaliphilus TaxID=79884 RepID=UPI00064DEE27|nr:DUF4179 domain-containing protein [Alkalihalobacillus pseudalcaliphilus]KMK76535.1 hypothetical protein AB990_15295 [Alkalihalobacillus pseudalcaliphilus]